MHCRKVRCCPQGCRLVAHMLLMKMRRQIPSILIPPQYLRSSFSPMMVTDWASASSGDSTRPTTVPPDWRYTRWRPAWRPLHHPWRSPGPLLMCSGTWIWSFTFGKARDSSGSARVVEGRCSPLHDEPAQDAGRRCGEHLPLAPVPDFGARLQLQDMLSSDFVHRS